MMMKFYMPKEVETYDNRQAYMAGFTNALVVAQLLGILKVDVRDLKISEYLSKEDIQKFNQNAAAM